MDRKRISISSKRQITIPQRYFEQLGFGDEAECMVRGSELIIRPAAKQVGGEFAEQILSDLIEQGYEGKKLLERFRSKQRMIRPAVEKLIAEADAMAKGKSGGTSLDELFDSED